MKTLVSAFRSDEARRRPHYPLAARIQQMLDVHIADSFEAASRNHPVCGFDVDVHELIFVRDNVPVDRFPLLTQMRDYYSDTFFAAHDLPALIGEVRSLIQLLPPRNAMVVTLEQFHNACETAISTQQNLYLFCD